MSARAKSTIHTTLDYWMDELLIAAAQRNDSERIERVAKARAEIHNAVREIVRVRGGVENPR